MKSAKIFTAIVLMILTFCPQSINAQIRGSGLMVAPTRLVFDKNSRSAELTLTNNGTRTNTFRIKTINSKMTETGEREIVGENDIGSDLYADQLVKFAPRQIRLKPGEQQTVRVMARITSKLKEGEYRTGLNLQWIPEPGEPDMKDTPSGNEGVTVKIQFAFGVTVPVIIRHGNLNSTGKIAEIKVIRRDKSRFLEARISREGNSSLYGDFFVYHVAEDGRESLVNTMGGVAIYVPNPHRIFSVALPENLPAGKNTGKGKLRVEYRERKENGGRLIAESITPID